MRRFVSILTNSCVLGAAVLITGCHKKSAGPLVENLPAAPVRVMPIASKKYMAEEEVIGTVHARLRATIEAKISGKIQQIPVVPGQTVKNGDLLVQLDVREVQAKLEQARAVREQSEQDLKRFEALLKQNAVTQQEYDAVKTRSRVAGAAVSEVETLLSYAQIIAPFAGVISRKLVEVGDLATPGRPLLELEDPGALRLEADVPEGLISRLRLNDKLTVRVAALTNDIAGIVSEMAPTADPNSRTFRVKLDLPFVPELRIGQFGRVMVPVHEVDTVRMPASALVVRGQMELVFAVVNQKAQLRLIKTGKRFGNEIEVVSGLSAAESIVTEGAAELVDGQALEVKQ